MTLQDAILLAGGFAEGATSKRIEVSRRVKNSDARSYSAKTADIYQIDINPDLNLSGDNFLLEPFDIITVRSNTGYEQQRQIRIEGEVLYPGNYTINNKDERISDLIKRAGGLTPWAYAAGASLKRSRDTENGTGKNSINKEEDNLRKLSNMQRLQSNIRDSMDIREQQLVVDHSNVGIALDKILAKPRSKYDLILEESDILRIPKQLQTIKIGGEVLYPVTAVYVSGSKFKHYISQAGGFTQKALKRRAYVIYANGSVDNTKSFLFFNNYPSIKPGAEIFVPKKAERRGLSTTEFVGLTSGLASLGAIIIGLINLSK
jgi:protein involved in polysaccharide export with SLBB domain